MYKNFKEYWECRKEILTKLGVTEDVAFMIWIDSRNSTCLEVIKDLLPKK